MNGGGGAAINGNLYVLGGTNGLSSSQAFPVSIYNPTTNTWSQGVSPIPTPTWDGPAVVVMNGSAYVIGGGNFTGQVNAVQAYNPASDSWTSLSALDTPWNLPAAAVVGGVIYIAGGAQAGSSVATAESFFQYPAGPIGPSGTPGSMGPQGPAGPIGLTGATGATGPQGPIGLTGAQGPQGVQGASGTNGTNGTNGTGFNFRGAFNTSTAYAINDVVTYAPAGNNITYNVNLTFGSAGSMVGTITTDGTIGVLNTSNIVSWNLTLADSATNSTLLTPSNSAFSSGNYNTGGQPNNDFTATSTTLTMTYSNAGFWGVSGTSGAFCMTDWSNCFGPIAYGTWSINGDNAYSESAVGTGSSQIIGTGGTVATPVTSTYVATGPVAAGTALPGTSPWVMMAQAGAAGATGATGLQGPVGLTGATGSAGPTGATGPQGPAGLTGATGATGPEGPPGTSGMGGSGTVNFLPLLSAATTLGDSVIQQAQPSGWSNTAVGFNGAPGSGVVTSPMGVDIQGTVSEGSPDGYSATQLVVEGTVASSAYAQAYLRGVIIGPNFNFSAGYGNYAEGAYIAAPNITSGYANVVSTLDLGQPAAGPSGTSCSAALNIMMPNQAGNCPDAGNRVWSIYNGSPDGSYFAGNVGFGIALPSYPIETGAGAYVTAGGVWTNASSREFKKDIQPLSTDQAMETLTGLDPVTFKYKIDDEAHVGFIAEDVPDLVATDDRKGLSAMDIVAVLTKVVQQQQKELSGQREEIETLKAQLAMGQGKR
jgi:hypothetical protein